MAVVEEFVLVDGVAGDDAVDDEAVDDEDDDEDFASFSWVGCAFTSLLLLGVDESPDLTDAARFLPEREVGFCETF